MAMDFTRWPDLQIFNKNIFSEKNEYSEVAITFSPVQSLSSSRKMK